MAPRFAAVVAAAVVAAAAFAATACKKRERPAPDKPPPATRTDDAGLAATPIPDAQVDMRRVDEARLEGAVELPPEEPLAERIPLLARLSSGEGAHAETPPLSRRDFDELMESALALITDMGDAAERAGKDCDQAAAAIERALADHEEFLRLAKRYSGSPEIEAMGKAWMETHQEELVGKAKALIEVASRCSANPKFQAVIAKLGDG